MRSILIRYAELGLKSERVRSRFLSQFVKDINHTLTDHGIEHLIKTERGRIFVETVEIEGSVQLLRTIPGIHSLSIVEETTSEMEGLMDTLSEFSSTRLKEGMTFGIRVKKAFEMPFSTRDIAIRGGTAVCSHLDEESVKVDLEKPDIWFEIEIRKDHAYIFTDRIPGIGGMPSSTQGKVLLFLPGREKLSGSEMISGNRARLSRKMMLRRGCRVIPTLFEDDLPGWSDVIEDLKEGGKGPFLLRGNNLMEALEEAVRKTDCLGIVHPGTLDDFQDLPVIHGSGMAVSLFLPTVSLNSVEVDSWLKRFR